MITENKAINQETLNRTETATKVTICCCPSNDRTSLLLKPLKKGYARFLCTHCFGEFEADSLI